MQHIGTPVDHKGLTDIPVTTAELENALLPGEGGRTAEQRLRKMRQENLSKRIVAYQRTARWASQPGDCRQNYVACKQSADRCAVKLGRWGVQHCCARASHNVALREEITAAKPLTWKLWDELLMRGYGAASGWAAIGSLMCCVGSEMTYLCSVACWSTLVGAMGTSACCGLGCCLADNCPTYAPVKGQGALGLPTRVEEVDLTVGGAMMR